MHNKAESFCVLFLFFVKKSAISVLAASAAGNMDFSLEIQENSSYNYRLEMNLTPWKERDRLCETKI